MNVFDGKKNWSLITEITSLKLTRNFDIIIVKIKN